MFGIGNKLRTVLSSTINKKPTDKVFYDIKGHEELKKYLLDNMMHEKNINILLNGVPHTAKTALLKCIEKYYGSRAVFIDCASTTTKAGIRDRLYPVRNKVKFVLFDEISRLKPADQGILLNLLQNGRITSTLSKGNKDFTMNALKCFATSNDYYKIIPPLRDRFDVFNMHKYNLEEFIEVGKFCIRREDKRMSDEVIEYLLERTYNDLDTTNIRLVINGMRTIRTIEDVDRWIDLKQMYKME
jgi:MoxR-like ATPase